MMALGLIETKGCLAAIEAADAMLKAAEVHLLEKHLVGGGLVTITVTGEVAAVKASIDAAVAAIGRITVEHGPHSTSYDHSLLVSHHVIARPDAELERILALEPEEQAVFVAPSPKLASPEPALPEPALPEPVSPEPASPEPAKTGLVRHAHTQLKSMSLSRLRQIAQTLHGLSLSPQKIATADKKVLIEAILNAYRQIEE